MLDWFKLISLILIDSKWHRDDTCMWVFKHKLSIIMFLAVDFPSFSVCIDICAAMKIRQSNDQIIVVEITGIETKYIMTACMCVCFTI